MGYNHASTLKINEKKKNPSVLAMWDLYRDEDATYTYGNRGFALIDLRKI